MKGRMMVTKSTSLLLGVSFLLLFYCFAGIGYDREWHDPHFFMKLKPYPKLFFQSAIGESDRAIADLPVHLQQEERLFEQYFEGNAVLGPFSVGVLLLLQAGIFYLLLSFHLAMQRQPLAVKAANYRIVFYNWLPCILIKIVLYVVGWNVDMLYKVESYRLLFSLYVLIDIPIFYLVCHKILVYSAKVRRTETVT